MGWKDYHLHEFEIAGQRYGVSLPPENVSLSELL
jgi:hypothetical protein